MSKPKISVVIGTLGRKELLKQSLEALIAQNFKAADFEIIVVTNGSEEIRTLIKLLPKPKNLSIKLVFCSHTWVAPKRNIGIRLAKNPIIAFIDDDCIADSEWLSVIAEQFEKNPKIAGVEGITTKTAKGLFEHATENTTGGLYPTCNLAFRKEILLKIGGFDEVYTYHREDTDLAFKALKHGQIPFCKDVKVFHLTRKTSFASVLKEVRWVRGDVRLYKKFPSRYISSFGFPAKGALKLGLFTLAIALVGAYGLVSNILFTTLAIVAFVVFTFAVTLRKRTWSLPEGAVYLVLAFIRNLLFIPSFVYYWIVMSGKENPADNVGWNNSTKLDIEEY